MKPFIHVLISFVHIGKWVADTERVSYLPETRFSTDNDDYDDINDDHDDNDTGVDKQARIQARIRQLVSARQAKALPTDRPTDGLTDRETDRWTDTTSYRVVADD